MSTLDNLRKMIEDQNLIPPARLPPERVLAGQLGVSRTTLRRALTELESEGSIWRHVGRGTFVGPRPTLSADSSPQITRMTNPAEVMEVRLIIEPRIAGMAALSATTTDIGQMERMVRKGRAAKSTDTFEYWDGALHQAMARAVRNNFLLAIFDTINSVRRDELWGRLKEATVNKERRAIYANQHETIVASIKDRDAAAAAGAMTAHLETVKGHLLDI